MPHKTPEVDPDNLPEPNVTTEPLWKIGLKRMGRPVIFETAEDLAEACAAYFEWVEDTPVMEGKVFNGKNGIVRAQVAHMHAMTIGSLCLHIGINEKTWNTWKIGSEGFEPRSDFLPIIEACETAIRDQKFVGAAAGLLNPNIIALDLGLAKKVELTGKDGGPIENITEDMTPAKAAEIYAKSREIE